MNYNLFLDDIRDSTQATFFGKNYTIEINTPTTWEIVKTYDEFINKIFKYKLPITVSFDHDLTSEHYIDGFLGGNPKYNTYVEKTGFECATWLINYCDNNKLPLPIYYCHSANPIGRSNILSALISYEKYYKIQKNIHNNNDRCAGVG